MHTHTHSFKIIITWTPGNFHHWSQKTEHCLYAKTFHMPSVIKPSPSPRDNHSLDFADKNVFYQYIPDQYCFVLHSFQKLESFCTYCVFFPKITFVKFICVVAYSSSLFSLFYMLFYGRNKCTTTYLPIKIFMGTFTRHFWVPIAYRKNRSKHKVWHSRQPLPPDVSPKHPATLISPTFLHQLMWHCISWIYWLKH